MQKLNIFIYRPDKAPDMRVIPDLCYTPTGQNYREWQKDQEEAYHYKVELIKDKCKSSRTNAHFVEVPW